MPSLPKKADQISNPMLRLGHRLMVVVRMDPALRNLVIEAGWRLLALKALFTLLPFKHQGRFFGRAVRPNEGNAHNLSIALSEQQQRLARQVGWAVWKVERHLPVEVVCLPMALVARRMLSKRGIESVMTFGAEQDKPAEEVGTHAWLDAGSVKVSGYPLALTHSPFVAYLLP